MKSFCLGKQKHMLHNMGFMINAAINSVDDYLYPFQSSFDILPFSHHYYMNEDAILICNDLYTKKLVSILQKKTLLHTHDHDRIQKQLWLFYGLFFTFILLYDV